MLFLLHTMWYPCAANQPTCHSHATPRPDPQQQPTLSQVYAIAFPYTRNGQVVNIKYRLLEEKVFWQVKGAEKIVFGYDQARLAISSSAQMNPSEVSLSVANGYKGREAVKLLYIVVHVRWLHLFITMY